MLFWLLACGREPDLAGTGDTSVLPSKDIPTSFPTDLLAERVHYLASEALQGRQAGSEGDLLGVAYMKAELQAAGFESPAAGWETDFVDSDGTDSVNLIGVRWGTDPHVGGEIVVVGAHHDHLGVAGNGEIYLGANDNASGMAVLLALADAFGADAPPDRTLVLAAWGSEEVNLDGSRAYVDDPPADLPMDKTVFYVNLDMLGTYNGFNVLYALDAVPGSVIRPLVSEAAAASRLRVELDDIGSLSDSVNFCEAGVPEVFFFTEDPDCYHEPCDGPDRLDYSDLAAVGDLVEVVVGELLSRDVALAAARAEGCLVL